MKIVMSDHETWIQGKVRLEVTVDVDSIEQAEEYVRAARAIHDQHQAIRDNERTELIERLVGR